MYEAGPNGTLLVGRNIEYFNALERNMRAVTTVDRDGVSVQGVQRFIRYSLPEDSAVWGMRLAARLEHPIRPGAIYFPGEVRGVRLFQPEERTIYFWNGDTLDPMLPNSGRELRYIWKQDEEGERWLSAQELDDSNGPVGTADYHIRRSGCLAWQYDSVAVVHCKPEITFEEKEPGLVFVLVNGELVHAWPEAAYAEMSPDTHHYLLATMVQGAESALLFTTGDLLVYRDHGWDLRVESMGAQEVSMDVRR